jgi:threonine synthase
MIQFYSTNNKNLKVPLKEAVLRGLAVDGGLFMPDHIPVLPPSFFDQIQQLSFSEIAFEVSKTLLHGALREIDLKKMVENTINFDAPLKKIAPDIYTLELFHGPTLSFKDFGARFMAQLMGYFVRDSKDTLNILVATSGDTGGAIAQAFLGVKGIRVFILYPKGKVSWVQEKQMTTLGHNIIAFEVDGTFDDCQRLVKQAFTDAELRQKLWVTSANSINIARLIPQSFYYFYAYAQLKDHNLPLVFSIPSGNFGNLTAGLIAKRMGLKVNRFIASTNVNNSIPRYLETGIFQSHPSIHTLSNAMDVGNPSNFARMQDLYNHDLEKMRHDIYGVSFTDSQTKAAMREVLDQDGYLLDPHGAVGYLGLMAYISQNPGRVNGIFLETADPVKFAKDVEEITHKKPPISAELKAVLSKEKHSIDLTTHYEELKKLLLKSR